MSISTTESPPATAPTITSAIKALLSKCDGAVSKDGEEFTRFDRRTKLKEIIEKVEAGITLLPHEEETAYYSLKKYNKQKILFVPSLCLFQKRK